MSAPEGRRQSQRIAKRSADDVPPASHPVEKSVKRAPAKAAPAKAAPAADEAAASLSVGDALPALVLLDQDNEEVRIAELNNTVLFTYPRANTPGCTKQAQCYRDASDEWAAAGYTVFGLSSDAPKSQKTWATKLGLKYRLLSDPDRELIGALTGSKSSTKRSHFVVRDGKLALSSVGVKPVEVRRPTHTELACCPQIRPVVAMSSRGCAQSFWRVHAAETVRAKACAFAV